MIWELKAITLNCGNEN